MRPSNPRRPNGWRRAMCPEGARHGETYFMAIRHAVVINKSKYKGVEKKSVA